MSKAAPFHQVFHAGQRVRLSAHAKASGIRLQSRACDRGVVVSQPSVRSVKVRPDNYKTTVGYSISFWEPDELTRRPPVGTTSP